MNASIFATSAASPGHVRMFQSCANIKNLDLS
ncbi:hypothetical protein DW143_10475 [Bacillus sonorensis]|nr:hypothetical protein DW143_10475 [Bacillus sonorensis]